MNDDRMEERRDMVKEQLEKRAIREPRLLKAMLDVPRHLFVPPHLQEDAYKDGALETGKGQSISQPYIVASMIELLDPKKTHRALEVGLGCGYLAAVLAGLVGEVFAVERESLLAEEAFKRLSSLGIQNIHTKTGDGSLGWGKKPPLIPSSSRQGAPRFPKASWPS